MKIRGGEADTGTKLVERMCKVSLAQYSLFSSTELKHIQQIEKVNQLVASTETVLTFKKEANKNETLQAIKAFV